MKKAMIILFFILLPVLGFTETKSWWYGGAARMLSLGEVTTTLPDYSNVYDLYSYGFPTAMLWRDKESVEDLAPAYNIRNLTGDKTWNDFGASNNFLGFWLGDNDVIVLKPGYHKEDSREEYARKPGGELTDYDNSLNNYSLNGDIQYMHKLAQDTGISVSLYSTNSSDISSDNYTDLPMAYTVNNDSDYSERDAGFNLCIDKHLGDIQLPYINNILPRLDLALSAGYKVKNIYNTGYLFDGSVPSTSTSLEKESDKLINANIGFVFTAPDKKADLVFNIAKSFVAGSSYYYNSGTSTSQGAVIDETRVDLNAKLDYYLTDFLLGSVRMQWMDPDYRIAAGLALVTNYVNIPVEYYKNDINGHVESYGGGIEYDPFKVACLRLGARRYSYDVNKIDYTAGLGIEKHFIMLDIAMDYETNKEAWARTNLLADIKAVW
jgi:hypothetical protein